MKLAPRFLACVLALPLACPLLHADQLLTMHITNKEATLNDPALDPKRIINESNNFLKNREPEMTASEYALYEKVVAMLSVQPDFAVTLLEGMMTEKEKPSPAFSFILGNAYYGAKNNAKAEANYLYAIERYPDFLRAWNNLAVLYYADGRHADAARCFSKAITLGDRAPNTYGLLGYCLERQGNFVGAEAAYLQALAGDVTQSDWTEGLMRIYVEGKQYTRAESLAKQLIQFKPKDGRFWLTYANIMLGSGRKFEAMAVLDTAVSLGIADTQARLLLGDLYSEKLLYTEALATYTSLRAEDVKLGVERLLRLSQMLSANKDFVHATEALNSAAKLGTPETASKITYARAELFLAKGDFAAARPLLEEVVQSTPLNGKAMLSLARSLAGLGESVKASIMFEHASQIPETAYPACLELANLELKLQHYERCLHYATLAQNLERSAAVEQFIAHVKTLIEAKS